ncbi:MAG: hypothetical protein M5U31_16495 [Acidimicrobiia bacterium]|nr:hypothetical protein [Acidimicrobiia bacterium]
MAVRGGACSRHCLPPPDLERLGDGVGSGEPRLGEIEALLDVEAGVVLPIGTN